MRRVDGSRRPQLAVGLDIGGTKTLAALLGPDGQVLGQARVPTTLGPSGVLDSAALAVRRVTQQAGVDLADVTGVGAGVPGLVDPSTGTVRHAVNLGVDRAALPLEAQLSQALDGIPVGVENDLNVAALGAAHLAERDGAGGGAGDGNHPVDLAFLALGTGLAAGLVLDGRLRRGAGGAAGEIGHVPVDPAGPLCSCGQRGCLELFASGRAVQALWPSRSARPAPVELFEAAAEGDPAAVRARRLYAGAVAAAVRLLVLSVDVRHVVLGGGVAQLGPPLLDAVREALVEQSAASEFLASLHLADRVRLTPAGVPVAAVGAAVVGHQAAARPIMDSPATSMEPVWKS